MRNPLSNFAIAAFIAAMAVSCLSDKDAYLKTLKLKPTLLVAADSINVDQYDLFQVRNVVALDGGWLVMSSVQGENHLLFLNRYTMEHFTAIRKGRGPGEIIQGTSLHRFGNTAAYYDVDNAICVKIKLSESETVALDTIGVFKNGSSKPVYMTSCGDGFVSGNLMDDKVWYSYYDNDGVIRSSVKSLDFDNLSKARDWMVSFNISSVSVSNPSAAKICVANVNSPSLSFSTVENGALEEYMRIAIPPAGVVNGRYTKRNTSAFNGISADGNFVYLIYSGRRLNEGIPVNECNHLIVYDWAGKPVRHYLLNRNVSSICIDGNNMWAGSTYPESCVYRFVMNDL